MAKGMREQKAAVDSGDMDALPLQPAARRAGRKPAASSTPRAPKLAVSEYMRGENRFRMLELSNPEAARALMAEAQLEVNERYAMLHYLATRPYGGQAEAGAPAAHSQERS
jgi:pyruvate-ferredoxin/flavodoxin oxidoreductase